jgi:hypothetical protein
MFKKTMIELVGEFHRIYNVKKGPLGHYVLLRNSLLWEEYNEYKAAKTAVERLDALTDMLYIASGTLEQCDAHIWDTVLPSTGVPHNLEALMNKIEDVSDQYWWIQLHASLIDKILDEAEAEGFDIEGAFQEVHDSNLSKLDDEGKPVFSPKGKVLKGPNYRPPRLERFTSKVKDIKVKDAQ